VFNMVWPLQQWPGCFCPINKTCLKWWSPRGTGARSTCCQT